MLWLTGCNKLCKVKSQIRGHYYTNPRKKGLLTVPLESCFLLSKIDA